jgi:hypothetical protein
MAIFTQTITGAQVLSALTTDTTKWAGANIANLDYAIATLRNELNRTYYLDSTVTWSASGGDNSGYYANTLEQFSIGTWYLKYAFTTCGSHDDALRWYFLREDGNNYYRVLIEDANVATSPKLQKNEAGGGITSLISGSNTMDTSEHYTEAIRDAYGNWDLEQDGTSEGTATDDFLPNTSSGQAYLSCVNSGGNSVVELRDMYHLKIAGY